MNQDGLPRDACQAERRGKQIADNRRAHQHQGRREGNQAGVWRLVDGDPQFVAVKLGRADLDGNVQVLEGLAEGDRIVVYSAQALGPRTRIKVVERIPGVD